MNTSPAEIKKQFKGKDIISIDQFDKQSVEKLMNTTDKIKMAVLKKGHLNLLAGKVVTLVFFEPSTRTFSSFAVAVKKLGGQTLEYQNPLQTSSAVKGETLEDTIKVFENYSDLIIIRHPQIGAAQKAADAAETIPVVNAGDGAGEHPTQALMDLYTIRNNCKRLHNLKGLIAGDLLFGRTVHSLVRALSLYENNTLYLLSPKALSFSDNDRTLFATKKIKLVQIESEKDIPTDCNFWYWTRVQKERFKNEKEYNLLKNKYILTKKLLASRGNKKTILMHPLPRVGEIETVVDMDKRALYLGEQIKNGLYLRMAIVSLLLGKI